MKTEDFLNPFGAFILSFFFTRVVLTTSPLLLESDSFIVKATEDWVSQAINFYIANPNKVFRLDITLH